MADSNNFSDINDNFDTIKTLLNSIRAQGILNTSDVDRLLEGINSKLEKINTEEDIDKIKGFLSELKNNLDERHEVLISKFGAIESLFSNLLKNSTDSVKSSELKELFDIVATNLSVFSREVVSQKETLTDITLRLDAMRSDDSQKKEIIKSISTARNDIEKINNGFDSIVISLNENFKTVLKTIADIDQSEALQSFTTQLSDILNSTNTILSAIELIDKKNTQVEDAFEGLATQNDTTSIQHSIMELSAKSQELINLVDSLNQKSYKIDNLSEKIDAAVDIIASLKADIADKDDSAKNAVLDKLFELEDSIKNVSSDADFKAFQKTLENVLSNISSDSINLKSAIETAVKEIGKLKENFLPYEINTSICNLDAQINKTGEELKEKLVSENDKMTQMIDFNINRAVNEISTNAEAINLRLKDSHSSISNLCEKSFTEVTENISNLKDVVAQLDENNISANNAIFSNITDRLAIFENSLKTSLEKQEDFISGSSENIFNQISNIKTLTDGIEYKLDSNAMELGNVKREYAALTESINQVLALDFVNVVKDLKADLYASKQDLADTFESGQNDLSESLTNDLFGKYELLISKLDSVEDEIKFAQTEALKDVKTSLSNISSSLVDVLSYVSSAKESNNEALEAKLSETTRFIQDSNLNYVENVRDIVDVVREQIENNLRQMSSDSELRLGTIVSTINNSNLTIQQDIKSAYEKIVELQNNVGVLDNSIKINNDNASADIKNILEAAENLKGDFDSKLNALKNSLTEVVNEFKEDFTCENADKISELKFNSETLHSKAVQQSVDLKNELRNEIATIIDSLRKNILGLNEQLSNTTLKIEGANKEIVDFVKNDFTAEVNNSVDSIKTNTADVLAEIDNKVINVVNGFNTLETSVNNLSKETTMSLSGTLAKILDNFVSMNSSLKHFDEQSAERLKETADELKHDFNLLKKKVNDVDTQVDEDLAHQISIIEGSFESLNLMLVDIMNQATDSLGEKIQKELSGTSEAMSTALSEELEQYKIQISELFDGLQGKNDEQAEYIKSCTLELNSMLNDTLALQNKDAAAQLEDIGNHLKEMIHANVELTSADYNDLKLKLDNFIEKIENHNNILVDTIKAHLDDIIKYLDSNLDIQSQEINSTFEEISSSVQKVTSTVREFNSECTDNFGEVKSSIQDLTQKLDLFLEESMANFVTKYTNSNTKLVEEFTSGIAQIQTEFNNLQEKIEQDELSRLDIQQSNITELKNKFNNIAESIKEYTKSELSSLSEKLQNSSTENADKADLNLETKTQLICEELDKVKQNTGLCQEIISNLIKEHSNIISKDIEKETDVILGELLDQFNEIKDFQKDELAALTTSIEGSVAGYVLDATNDLKSYFDMRTDTSVIDGKIEALRQDLMKSIDDTSENVHKMLEVSVFNDTITDLRAANEVLIETMTDKLNTKLQNFVKENVTNKFEDKLNLLDKKFIDTIVDKYEEVKILSTEYNKAFEKISDSVSDLIDKFEDSKKDINNNLQILVGGINNSIDELKSSFADLKAQIMNKSFDEAFHESVHNQISGIEDLVKKQMDYLEDISEICCNNLPEVAEMNTIVKHGIQKSVSELHDKLNEQEVNISEELNKLKSDIITQFINVFNQISFVAEQEEILDFIQEKHSELITVLSHIVTNSDNIETVKDNLSIVDNKIDSIKEDIDLINEKITSIMSSDGNIDYVYSLQDLESDIANLRLALNEMKRDNKSKEFEELINSTNNIYEIVGAIKSELPKFDTEEFKKDFNNLSEDIVSISTRTNKLILTSDESYKTLQDNLQDFKLVIDDLDERTRNFAKESGIDKLDTKLCAINTMIQNGAKTNQVFNQVFEYLAEWVDKAGEQIASISDKVETLDDISQIKMMIEDLRAESQDSTDSEEFVKALESVFEKQTKRITSIETKLDKIIVSNKTSSKTKSDIKPLEDTLNKFLTSLEEKISSQQDRINSLEIKMEEIVSLMDNKDTAQLTKKVGGMDKQLAKLNKSIEKIASNVVEK